MSLTTTDGQYTQSNDVAVLVHEGTNQPPVITLGPDLATSYQGDTVLSATATDDGLPFGTLETTWSQVSGPSPVKFTTLNGVYRATFDFPGHAKPALPAAYVLRFTASDGQYTNSADLTVTVYDALDAPFFSIASPLDGSTITAPTVVTGSVSSAVLRSYRLEYRLKPADGADADAANGLLPPNAVAWSLLSTGATSVVNGPLGTWDPTLQLNGIYEIRLTAEDTLGRSATTDPVTVVVDKNLKIGQLTLYFNDLTVPVAGLPIQIVRTYDSRDQRVGDFGVGWTLDLNNIRLQKNRPLGKNWFETTTGSPYDLSLGYHLDPGKPRLVTLTFPDGKVSRFNPF